jgi:dynein heavy chain
MPQVKRILHIMLANQQRSDGFSLEPYNTQYQQFSKAYAKAKDFVKFLSTLERQFKQLKNDMSVIEETLPSLLTGLKLIWTISRLINQKETEMEEILDAISHEICDKVKSQIDITKIFKIKPSEAIVLIRKGKAVLLKWKAEFDATRTSIGNELTVKRWEF